MPVWSPGGAVIEANKPESLGIAAVEVDGTGLGIAAVEVDGTGDALVAGGTSAFAETEDV